MGRGILLGLAAQVAFALGFVSINQASSVKNQILTTSVVLCFAGSVAVVFIAYFVLIGDGNLKSIELRQWVYLGVGSLLALVIGELFFIWGMAASNVTTVGYTALAYPVIALTIEWVQGKVSVTWRDMVGFLLLAAGFVLVSSKPNS